MSKLCKDGQSIVWWILNNIDGWGPPSSMGSWGMPKVHTPADLKLERMVRIGHALKVAAQGEPREESVIIRKYCAYLGMCEYRHRLAELEARAKLLAAQHESGVDNIDGWTEVEEEIIETRDLYHAAKAEHNRIRKWKSFNDAMDIYRASV